MSQYQLCDAIRQRRVVRFIYKGVARTAEPHTVGYDRDGDLTLCAWQLSGGSGQGFRDFHVAKLSGLSITDQCFARPRPKYNPNDRTLSRIVCRL